ncbi:SRPBCC family protein [Paractinoplanes rhizophilus]|uniref:SRPBCC family protein n=1 Tax=Paractinoplanes rhizophilus TaxID=1416877 RepID=A0ABW2HZN7_9ACTN
MKITNEFTVHTPIERAWAVLTDLEGIAPCMPGARLTGVEGDTYKGKVKVKVGPVVSEFAGTARLAEKDEAAYRAVIDAKGRDARSAGNAAALVTAVLTPAGSSTSVSVDTDLKISGKLAQFGSGMIKEVSGKLLAQFVDNLEAKLAAEESAPAATESPAAEPPTGTEQPSVGDSSAGVAGSVTAEPEAVPAPTEGAVPSASVSPRPKPAAASPAAASPSAFSPSSADEPEPLDLLSVAGSSIYKRAIPVVIGVVVVGAVIAWAIARR